MSWWGFYLMAEKFQTQIKAKKSKVMKLKERDTWESKCHKLLTPRKKKIEVDEFKLILISIFLECNINLRAFDPSFHNN